jgi:hypothetical protein
MSSREGWFKAKMNSAKASLLEANLGLSLAQGELKRATGKALHF